ncbi:MAG: DNA polymerase III subunit beta [Spirochaetaceae bacterium]|jgi:DNA polymerase-3 subunit beta|nr:DNA polymerase III subunit beta [Spirochaetaceae bacterium]
MKFVCEKGALLKEIAIAQEIIGSKNTISALSNVFLEAANDTLIIKATDVRVFFETKVPVSIDEEGKTTVRGSMFFNILNSIPDGEIIFEKVDNKIVIKPKDKTKQEVTYKLKFNTYEQYPETPSDKNAGSFEMPVIDFKNMISQTIFAVSDDETRYLMNGVYFEKDEGKFIMVATDGRRLAYAEKNAEDDAVDFSGIIIPEKILSIVQKHAGNEGNVLIKITDKTIFVSFGLYNFSSSLIEGQYPNYKRVIPEGLINSFVVKRAKMLDALKRVFLLVEKNNRIFVKLSAKNGITLFTQDSEEGDASALVEGEYNGEDAQIALNYHYIEEPCKVMQEEDVIINFNDTSKAITIKPVPEKDFFHVVMPMQID